MKKSNKSKKKIGKPIVSIIIPIYNRSHFITLCLEALNKQKTSISYEIVLVDDGSTDDTLQTLQELHRKDPNRIHVFGLPRNRGQWKARNEGIKNSRGSIIAFIDSDCVAQPDWLEKLTEPIRKGDVLITQGYSTGETKNHWQKIIQESYDKFMKSISPGGYSFGFDTRNAACAKEVFDKIGMFEVRHAEDADLGMRMIRNKYKIRYVEKAIIFHYHRRELWKDLKANYNFGLRHPLILARNQRLFKIPSGLLIRVIFGIFCWILLLGSPLWIFLFPIAFLEGTGIMLLGAFAKSIFPPYDLVLYRVQYHICNAMAASLGFVKGIPIGMRGREPEEDQ